MPRLPEENGTANETGKEPVGRFSVNVTVRLSVAVIEWMGSV